MSDREQVQQRRWRAAGATLLLAFVSVRLLSALMRRMEAQGLAPVEVVLGVIGLVVVAAIAWWVVVPMWRRARPAASDDRSPRP